MADTGQTASDPRARVLNAGPGPLWEIALAIPHDGAAFPGGASARLVSDVLSVGEPDNWPKTTRDSSKIGALFTPHIEMTRNGLSSRSFLPEDLAPEDESPLRSLAVASENRAVRARIYEVLWARFQRFPDVTAAIDARIGAAAFDDPETDWPDMVKNLGRLTTLILRVNASKRVAELVALLEKSGAALASSSYPFAFPVLVDMVANTLLAKKGGRASLSDEMKVGWTEQLVEIAGKYRGDDLHGHDALVVLQHWLTRLGDQSGAGAARREVVEHLRECARAADASLSPTLAQKALQVALDYGLADLADLTRAELAAAVRQSVPTFKAVSGTFSLPSAVVKAIDDIVLSSPSPSVALRRLVLLPGLLEVDRPAIVKEAQEQLKDSPFYALVPKVRYDPEGKVTHTAGSFEESVDWHASTLIGFRLTMIEAAIGYFLRQTITSFSPTTLLDSLAEWPHLAAARRVLLTTASERFHAKDWISAGTIVVVTYEAVLRDLLRAGGYAALKNEPGGVQLDETLNSMLRSTAATEALGQPYCSMAEFVLCEPGLGWNLRNDVAHGSIRPDALRPARIVLLWLLTIRLSCFVAGPVQPRASSDPEPEEPAEDDDGAPPSQGPESGS